VLRVEEGDGVCAWVAITDNFPRKKHDLRGFMHAPSRIVSAVVRKNCAGGLASFFIKSLYHPSAVRLFAEFYGTVGIAKTVKIMHGFRTLKAFGSVRICNGNNVNWLALLECVYGMALKESRCRCDSWVNFFSVKPNYTFSSENMDFYVVLNHDTAVIASCPHSPSRRDLLETWAERNRVSFLDMFDPDFVVDSLFLHECRFVCGSLTVNGMCTAMRELVLAIAGDESLSVESQGLHHGGKMFIARREDSVFAIASCSKTDIGFTLRVKRVNDDATRRLFLLFCQMRVTDPLAAVDAFSPFELLYCASYIRTSFLFMVFTENDWLKILEIVIGTPIHRAETIPEGFDVLRISSLLTWLGEWEMVYAFVGPSSFLMEHVGQRWMFVFELHGNQVLVASSCVMGYFLGL
jgi:hypothetical protein